MNQFKFWLTFSIGVAAGAAVALLCAPQTGAKTREQLKRKLDDAGDYLKDQVDDASDYLKDQASTLGQQAGKVYQRGKEVASNYSDEMVDNLQAAAKSVKSRVS